MVVPTCDKSSRVTVISASAYRLMSCCETFTLTLAAGGNTPSQESLTSTGLCERVQESLDGRYSTEQIRVFELHMKDHTLTDVSPTV